MNRHLRLLACLAALAPLATACTGPALTGRMAPAPLVPPKIQMLTVAESPRQWTGVAVSHTGRIFVNFPRWSDDVPISVAELRPAPSEGFSFKQVPLVPVAYPDSAWQSFTQDADHADHPDPKNTFVCVQSVVVDDQDFLWVVDAGAPKMGDILPSAPKLIKINLQSNQVERIYPIDPPALEKRSYLNDVRIDTHRGIAYLTDSGAGAILTVNLNSGEVARRLAGHPSVMSERATPVIDNKPWLRNGQPPEVHSDGIALSPDGKWLYYHALTGRTLYRIPTDALLTNMDPNAINRVIQNLGRTGPADGIEYDSNDCLFLTQLDQNAIVRFIPNGAGNHVQLLVQDPAIAWPDSLAIGPDGALYFTTSQINLQPNPPGPYRLFKLIPKPDNR